MDRLDQSIIKLAHLSGIEYETSVEVKTSLLKSMGILSDDLAWNEPDAQKREENALKVEGLIKDREDADYINIVHHIPILRQHRVRDISISLPEGATNLRWHFYENENPRKYYRGALVVNDDAEQTYQGEIAVNDLKPDYDKSRVIDGVRYQKYRFEFPFDVSLGYHKISFEYEDQNGETVSQTTLMISAPEKCYDGLGIDKGKKTWGVPVQLYEQVSANNIGIGNYGDLAQLAYILGKNGAGLLGVNPLHAMMDSQPEVASPYSPDSRMFFNYIYIDVTAVEEFKNSPDIQAYFNSDEFQDKVNRNRRRGYVDYQVTQELVDDILHRCFEKFDANKDSEEHTRFELYCDEQDGILDKFAIFHALSKEFSKLDPAPVDFSMWPEAYRDPNSKEVAEFARKHRDEIEYYKYVQYLCEIQLQNVKEVCINSGMSVGLYMDMAVGTSRKGFEAWYYSDLYLKGTSGAKPDILSKNGQRWELLGFNPQKLQEMGYEPYRRILETNMRYAGCLRIDHVLQLNRLYMFPDGAKEGNYVYYNSEELLAMVALESHRHKTMVIGEDLGDVSAEFKDKMADFGVLSYKVLPFERRDKNQDFWRSMKAPEEYNPYSVCTSSTHDTPTLASQWNVRHVWQQKILGILDEKQSNETFEEYATLREALTYALEKYSCWGEVGGTVPQNPHEDANNVPEKLLPAVMSYLGQARSSLMLVPFTDIFGISEMGNIPGTKEIPWSTKSVPLEVPGSKIYPCWRKKSHFPIDHIEEIEQFKEIVGLMQKYRPDGNDGRGRYYQFTRSGANNPSVIDFENAKRWFNILRNKESYQITQLIQNRYNERYRDRMERHSEEAKRLYEQQKQQWLMQQEMLKRKKRNGRGD